MIDRIDKGRQSLVIAFLDPLKPAWVENVLNDFISDIPMGIPQKAWGLYPKRSVPSRPSKIS